MRAQARAPALQPTRREDEVSLQRLGWADLRFLVTLTKYRRLLYRPLKVVQEVPGGLSVETVSEIQFLRY